MSSPASPTTGQAVAADAQITAERSETKYLVPVERSRALMGVLSTHLPAHRYRGEGENRLPGARHFITTVYFDTPTRALLRIALERPRDNLKVRVRQYYDFHPGLAEVATQAGQLLRYQPSVWLELKRRQSERTSKLRRQLVAGEVKSLLRGGATAAESIDDSLARELADLRVELGEALRESCVAHYQRVPFQDADGMLRVTVDFGLAFYAPAPGLWNGKGPLRPSVLGLCRAKEARVLVEVKSRAAPPPWLESALQACHAEASSYSKFVQAGCAVHGVC